VETVLATGRRPHAPIHTAKAFDRLSCFQSSTISSRECGPTLLRLLSGLGPAPVAEGGPAERVYARLVIDWRNSSHDVGNERRLAFIPSLVALAAGPCAITTPMSARLARDAGSPATAPLCSAAPPWIGAAVRLPFADQIHAGVFRSPVRLSATLALAAGLVTYLSWPRVPRLLAQVRWSPAVGAAVACALIGADLWQYSQWAEIRTFKNHEAMVAIGRWLPPGTLVHGKLANGLALESRITPVFVGRGFGNYDDRTRRTDIRYLLTHVQPSLGFESQRRNPVINESEACLGWKIVREFDVAETPSGRDRAVLTTHPERK
jgi:hypothetical protein